MTINDSHRGRSANFREAMRNSAERRRCPKCERKSALVRVPDDTGSVTYCRWNDCDYERVYDRTVYGFGRGRRG